MPIACPNLLLAVHIEGYTTGILCKHSMYVDAYMYMCVHSYKCNVCVHDEHVMLVGV